MPCLVGCLALSAPRFAIVLVVLFSDYIGRAFDSNLWPLLEEGKVAPVIDSVFPLASAADAHRRMESSEHIGKIVLEVAG